MTTIPTMPQRTANWAGPSADLAPTRTNHGPEGGPVCPVFVIGSQRSGASLLALALGQHPHIVPVPDTAWVERFALGVQQTFLEDAAGGDLSQLTALGIDVDRFFAQFGQAIDGLMRGAGGPVRDASPEALDPPRYTWHDFGVATGRQQGTVRANQPARWVDACYTHCFNVFLLQRLFPAARFIHIIRDVDEVVTSLIDPRGEQVYKSRYVAFTARDAYEHWLDAVSACVEAERALGSTMVTRIRRRDLMAWPEATLRRCLSFLDEPFDDRCLLPFESVPTCGRSKPDQELLDEIAGVPSELRQQAELLSFALTEEPATIHPRPRSDSWLRRLEAAFVERSAHTAPSEG